MDTEIFYKFDKETNHFVPIVDEHEIEKVKLEQKKDEEKRHKKYWKRTFKAYVASIMDDEMGFNNSYDKDEFDNVVNSHLFWLDENSTDEELLTRAMRCARDFLSLYPRDFI